MREQLTFCDPDVLERRYLEEFLSQGRVPQNLFYWTDGATTFYSYRNADLAEIAWREEVAFFMRQPFCGSGQRVAFVSLGCGSAAPEKPLLRRLQAAGCPVHYVGVDTSARMLDLAAENLSEEDFQQHLILGDFGDPDFRARLDRILDHADRRVTAMIGGTFGNFDQRHVAQVLHNLVAEGDYLYLDVVPLPENPEENIRLEDRFARLPQNLAGFFEQVLDKLGLSLAQGRLVSKSHPDRVLRTIRQTFYFEATESITLSCLGEQRTLSSGQQIELMTIRAYNLPSLVDFLGDHGFNLVDSYEPDVGRLGHRWSRLLFIKA